MKRRIMLTVAVLLLVLPLLSCSGRKRGDFSDSAIPEEEIEASAAGDVIVFGKYEQDNDPSNGKEDVEWLVIAKKGDKRLVISKYALDSRPFNEEYSEDVTWETCTLRSWLNGTFLSDAFTAEEQEKIVVTKVKADQNPSFGTDPGKNTEDLLFLLSLPEAKKYFSDDSIRMCAPTEYAVSRGAYTDDGFKADGRAACWWLLRTPGDHPFLATYVNVDGTVNDYGYFVTNTDCAVRPAMWINVGD